MKINKQCVVLMEYTLTNDAGEVLDTSAGRRPLSFIQGLGNIIPGLDKELVGRQKGDKFKVRVKPSEGYGDKDDSLIQVIPKEQLANIKDMKIGMQLQAEAGNELIVLTVTKIGKNDVTLDGNHPLAGVHLTFDVEVVDVRPATTEELEHGHAHGVGGEGHQHD